MSSPVSPRPPRVKELSTESDISGKRAPSGHLCPGKAGAYWSPKFQHSFKILSIDHILVYGQINGKFYNKTGDNLTVLTACNLQNITYIKSLQLL